MAALVVSAAALLVGIDWRLVTLAMVGFRFPWMLLAGALAWGVVSAMRRRRGRAGPEAEAAFHTAVASELRGGGSLRFALRDAAADVPALDLSGAVRYLAAGAPAGAVAVRLAAGLPSTGRAAAAAMELAAASGARAASVFEVLAERAAFEAELAREQQALTSQARLSALIVGGGPLLFGVGLLATGRAGVLLDHGAAGIAAGVIGLGLELAGLLAVALLMRRAGA